MLKFWKSHAHELEARLKRCAEPDAQQETQHQPGGDVRVDVQSGLECLAEAVTDVAEASVYEISPSKSADEDATCETAGDIPGGTGEEQSTQETMAEAAAPVDGCYDVGDTPHCSESHVQPCAKVEDAGKIADDAAGTPCGEHDVSTQEPA